VQESKQILKEEIEALPPKLIVGVGVGKLYADIYRQHLSGYGIPLRSIPHYAPQFNNSDKKKRFRRKVREIRKFYKKS
jgi:uracil-DNA glycosylase